MNKILFLIILIFSLAACTVKSETCDLIDSEGQREVLFQEYMDDLDANSHLELTKWLTEEENSIKGLRLAQTRECAEFVDPESTTINNKKYTILYNRTSDLTFEMGFKVGGKDYWYSRR